MKKKEMISKIKELEFSNRENFGKLGVFIKMNTDKDVIINHLHTRIEHLNDKLASIGYYEGCYLPDEEEK